MSEKTKKVINHSVNAVFGILVVIILMFSIFAFSSKRNGGIPKVFGKSYVTVLSDSMKGEFKRGDLIVIKRYSMDDLVDNVFEVGDIITFQAETDNNKTIYITHRIIEVDIENQIYITQGDVQAKDPTTYAKEGHIEKVNFYNVVGLYQGTKLKVIGSIFLFIQTKIGFFLIVILPLVLFLIYQSLDFKKALDEYKEEKKSLEDENNKETINVESN